MAEYEKKSNKKSFLTEYFEGASESAIVFAGIGLVVGAVYGAIQGWSILPPETINMVQALTAAVGLIVGAIVGFIVGFMGAHLVYLAIIFGILYGLGAWLFSS